MTRSSSTSSPSESASANRSSAISRSKSATRRRRFLSSNRCDTHPYKSSRSLFSPAHAREASRSKVSYSGSPPGHSHASSSTKQPFPRSVSRCLSATRPRCLSKAAAASASSFVQRSSSQKPYFLMVHEARSCKRSSHRRLLLKAGVFLAFMKCSYSGRSSSKTKSQGCLTRVQATNARPATPAVFEDKCTLAVSSVMPCAL